MFGLFKKIFIGLLTGLVNASNQTNCVLLINQKCEIQTTLISFNSNEYNEEFHYYPFSVKLDKYILEVVKLWMIYLIKHESQIKQKI